MNLSQSPIRAVRALSHYGDVRRYGLGPWQAWRECWAIAGGHNPIPNIIRAINTAIEGRPPDVAHMMLDTIEGVIYDCRERLSPLPNHDPVKLHEVMKIFERGNGHASP